MLEKNVRENLVCDGLVPIKEAAGFLGISVGSLYAMMGRGELVYVKLGRSRRIPRRALVELAAKFLVSHEET
ncbi:MAG: helix-turn-helix domain-containing protein [Planctomycetes bacterium]|nr:helix-turn-helix domain-containing protein [Planctomycetota bacterium]